MSIEIKIFFLNSSYFINIIFEVTKIWAELFKDLNFAERNNLNLTKMKEFGLLKEMIIKLQ